MTVKYMNRLQMHMAPIIHSKETGKDWKECKHEDLRGKKFYKSTLGIQCRDCKAFLPTVDGVPYSNGEPL